MSPAARLAWPSFIAALDARLEANPEGLSEDACREVLEEFAASWGREVAGELELLLVGLRALAADSVGGPDAVPARSKGLPS
jgi:hypothetical protein